MSVPAIRRSTIESRVSREEEIQALADISFHRVWWKRRWVLWFDDPFTFETQRPWSHRSLPRQALVSLLSASAALWALSATLEIPPSSKAIDTFTWVAERVFAVVVSLLGMTLIVSVSMLFISRSRNGH